MKLFIIFIISLLHLYINSDQSSPFTFYHFPPNREKAKKEKLIGSNICWGFPGGSVVENPPACWRRLLRVPWTARRANQSILKEISPGCSLEGLMLKLKLQYFGCLMRETDSLEKTLILGKTAGRRGRGRQRVRWLDGITNLMDMSLSKL